MEIQVIQTKPKVSPKVQFKDLQVGQLFLLRGKSGTVYNAVRVKTAPGNVLVFRDAHDPYVL